MAMTLITTNTESGDANSAFTSSIDSTYKLYVFKWFNVNPATDNVQFTVNFSDDTSSHSYDLAKTTTFIHSYSDEDVDDGALAYSTVEDLAQGTGYQTLAAGVGSDADQHCSGTLHLFNPSNTTYVKHFYSNIVFSHQEDWVVNNKVAGYINTTAAVTAVDFKFSSGNMDGTIKMYGVG